MGEFDVVLTYVKYHDGSGGKSRPVLLVSVAGRKVGFFKITTRFENKSEYIQSMYYEIKDWAKAGLSKKSWVDTVKPVFIDSDRLSFKFLGRFSDEDIYRLTEFIKERYN